MKRLGNVMHYLFIVMINVAIMLVFHSYLNFLLLIIMLVVPVYSLWSVYQIKNSIRISFFAPTEHMHKGEEFLLRIVLDNPTWFPLLNATLKIEVENVFYGEKGEHYLNIPVRARRRTEVQYPLVMDYSGRFCAKAKEIAFLDLLGFCELKLHLQEDVECLVLPSGTLKNQEAGHIYINGVTESIESNEKGYDFSEINGIREYIPGDKLQNIHWKLSVKKDELMVKERVSVSATQLHVLVELANDEEMRLDAVLDLADSVSKSFVSMNLPFTVYYCSENLGELRESYIGNEIERIQWMEMMLYDQCYHDAGRVEEMFLQHYGGSGKYLYIGYAQGDSISDSALYGEKGTVAELRSR